MRAAMLALMLLSTGCIRHVHEATEQDRARIDAFLKEFKRLNDTLEKVQREVYGKEQ